MSVMDISIFELHRYDNLAFNPGWTDILIYIFTSFITIGISVALILAFAWVMCRLKGVVPNANIMFLIALAYSFYSYMTGNKEYQLAINVLILIFTISLFGKEIIIKLLGFVIKMLVVPFLYVPVIAITVVFTAYLKYENLPLIVNWVVFIPLAVIIIEEVIIKAIIECSAEFPENKGGVSVNA